MMPKFEFVTSLPDPSGFEALLRAFLDEMAEKLIAAGGPTYQVDDLVAKSMANLDDILPPKGRLLLATAENGELLGCGVIRHIRPDAAEFKRMYVHPKARGMGLGRTLFEYRVEEARRMGCRTLYADTIKGNNVMLAMYENFGFSHISRYPENANGLEMAPYLIFLKRELS